MMSTWDMACCAIAYLVCVILVVLSVGIAGHPFHTIPGVAMGALFAGTATKDIIHHKRILRRKREGHCLHCGYDLRESADDCPECGAAVSTNVQPDQSGR